MAAKDAVVASQRLDKLAKLVAAVRDEQEKIGVLLKEMDALLEGHAGIGADLKKLRVVYDTLWTARYGGTTYGWAEARDAHTSTLKRLLKTFSVEDVESRMAAYIKSDEQFYRRQRHPFRVFVAAINSFAKEAAWHGTAAVGCQHEPPCGTDAEHTLRRMAELAT